MKAKEPKFIALDKYDITGNCICSNNKTYMVAWDLGEKTFILLKNKELSYAMKNLLIFAGDVSDNGFVIVAGAQNREDKESEVAIYEETGGRLFSKQVKAKVYNLGIAPDGKKAVFQTFNSMISEEDNSKLFVIDVTKNEVTAVFHCPLGWADCYQFFDDKIRLHFGRKHIDYSFCGECLESKKLEKETL